MCMRVVGRHTKNMANRVVAKFQNMTKTEPSILSWGPAGGGPEQGRRPQVHLPNELALIRIGRRQQGSFFLNTGGVAPTQMAPHPPPYPLLGGNFGIKICSELHAGEKNDQTPTSGWGFGTRLNPKGQRPQGPQRCPPAPLGSKKEKKSLVATQNTARNTRTKAVRTLPPPRSENKQQNQQQNGPRAFRPFLLKTRKCAGKWGGTVVASLRPLAHVLQGGGGPPPPVGDRPQPAGVHAAEGEELRGVEHHGVDARRLLGHRHHVRPDQRLAPGGGPRVAARGGRGVRCGRAPTPPPRETVA